MDDQKGCQFCYYEHFDGKAYPCSMCIRGEDRTDKFEPKGRQTKQTDCAVITDTSYQVLDGWQTRDKPKTTDCPWK